MSRKRCPGSAWDKSSLACRESIAHLWGYPHTDRPFPPSIRELFTAIAEEATACLAHTDWEDRIRRMENILAVIKGRMLRHWESWHQSELDKLVSEAKKEVKSHVDVEIQG